MKEVRISAQVYDAMCDSMTRWLELVIGELGVDWDLFFHSTPSIEDMSFIFRHDAHASHFEAVWGRHVLSFPFDVWMSFCIAPMFRSNVEKYWSQQLWEPETVLANFGRNYKRSVVTGARKLYRPGANSWFFEREVDAILFFVEHYDDGKSHN